MYTYIYIYIYIHIRILVPRSASSSPRSLSMAPSASCSERLTCGVFFCLFAYVVCLYVYMRSLLYIVSTSKYAVFVMGVSVFISLLTYGCVKSFFFTTAAEGAQTMNSACVRLTCGGVNRRKGFEQYGTVYVTAVYLMSDHAMLHYI